MSYKLTFIAFISLFIFSACSVFGTPETPKTNLPVLSGAWRIKMTHSGGIMGLLRSIEINSDGNFTVIDERANTTKQGLLPNDDLEKIIETVNTSEYVQYEGPYGCADCFIYDIEITSDGGNFTAQVDDVTIGDSGLGTLVMTLREILERELK